MMTKDTIILILIIRDTLGVHLKSLWSLMRHVNRSVLCVKHQEIITHMENVCAPLRRSDQSNQLRVLGVKNQIH
jgi:hypothetical protein